VNGIVLAELTPQAASLEEAFMELTHDEVEYRNSSTITAVADGAGVAA
jgi:ABC-2 type transport system ATP-binding protein